MVYIDGKLINKTTPFSTEIEKGRHMIEVKKAGYKSVQEDIEISKNFELTKELIPEGKVVTKPRQEGAGPAIGNLFKINQ